MKIISSKAHAALDYLTVVIFALAPTAIGLTGTSAIISYVLAAVHLSMTLVTDMPFSLVKIVPIKLHALVEFLAGQSPQPSRPACVGNPLACRRSRRRQSGCRSSV